MVEIKYNIFEIDSNSLLRLDVVSDENLKSYLEEVTVPGTFIPNEDFIELSYYTLDKTQLLSVNNYTRYSVLSGDSKTSIQGNSEITIDPLEDYKIYYNDSSEVKALYHFLRNPFRVQDTDSTFSIESISPDRTELRLIPISLGATTVNQLTSKLEDRLESSTYNLDIHLYSNDDIFYPIVNVGYRDFRGTTAVVVKLADPIPQSVKVYSVFSIVEKISNSLAFEINTTLVEEAPPIPTLRGANFNIGVGEQTNEASEYFNYNELFSFPTNNSNRELNSLFNEKGAELGLDYSEFDNFINFSSIEERLRNFRYKIDLVESYQTSLDIINTTGNTYNVGGITGSRDYYENLLDGVVNNFDHYERNLYYESGSNSWPKSNNTKPYSNQQSSTPEATTWYSARLQEAVLYDAQNPNILTNTIPSYLKEDASNDPYNLFINMIGQHFDNLWVYTDAVSKKYDNDNRLNRGVSKDLVEELLKNFGIKLYTSNKSAEDLFKYFIVNSYDVSDEYLPSGIIDSGEQPLSQNDYQKEIYKRIYHNLPILLKSKGTERGLRALINCFGIPSDILKIKIFGGQSALDLPYFGGEQAWTGSIDKIRLDNTGSIVEGNTLSYYTGITRGDSKYTQDLHRIEVGFSPSDNMDTYIVSQSAVLFPNDPFNIDDYIGDPRGYESNIYPDLYKYSKIIFENVDSYDLKDFVRLIKFFDNVVFRMIKDFVPARAVADTGIIIKPHLLERYHAKSPVMTWTRPEYSGSIDTAFISGSNAGAYKNIGTNAVGSLFNKESSTRAGNVVQTPLGNFVRSDKQHEEPKYNGELKRAVIKITDGELNRDNPFKNLKYATVQYIVQFHKDPADDVCTLLPPNPPQLALNPEASNASNYPLPTLFNNVSNIIDFEIIRGGFTPTSVLGGNITYDFTNNNQYTQYELIEVRAYHPAIANCELTREVILVKCDLNYTGNGVPQTLTPGPEYNFTLAVNTGENTELVYKLNGVEISEPTSHSIQTGDFNDGSTITLTVQDINNPLGCVVTANYNFSSCLIISLHPKPFITLGIPQFIAPPYTFQGITTDTNYEFRIVWDNQSVFSNQALPPFNPNRFGQWTAISPMGGQVPATNLSDIINIVQYSGADNIVDYSNQPAAAYEDTFTTIETHISDVSSNFNYTFHDFHVQFKAIGECTVVSDNLFRLEDSPTAPNVTYNQIIDAFYSPPSAGNNPEFNSICCMNNIATIYLGNYQTLYACFNDSSNGGVPLSEPYSEPPTAGNPQGVLAQQGYYSTGVQGDSKYAFWNLYSNGTEGFWSSIQVCGQTNSQFCN